MYHVVCQYSDMSNLLLISQSVVSRTSDSGFEFGKVMLDLTYEQEQC